MANATEIGKIYGKVPTEWLRLPSTISFLNTLIAMGKSLSVDSLIVTKSGGTGGGGTTWMHRTVLLEYSRWLEPRFAIWCNDKIMELMNSTVVL
jgi:hypothetical protein